MTESSLSKWEQVINKLLEYTQDEKLLWETVNPADYVKNEDTNGAMLFVEHDGKNLVLYRRAHTRFVPANIMGSVTGSGRDVKEYLAVLAIYDLNSNSILYRFPYSKLTEDLYKSATFYTAGVQDFIDNLLESNNS